MISYSNEIVFRGHPDKVCDQISGAILDYCLSRDSKARVGVEVCGGKSTIFITGEITCDNFLYSGATKKVKDVLNKCGYSSTDYNIVFDISQQSADIAQGVNNHGAGDQGMMFGYAVNEPYNLPLAQVILIQFAKTYDKLRRSKKWKGILLSDGKAQITGIYSEDMKLKEIQHFVISYQNDELHRKQTDKLLKNIATKICKAHKIEILNFHINPTGAFKLGGFKADSGLTGRKIVVDAYQSFANVGGGCWNGKDPTKVDLTASHFARKLAIETLKKEKAEWCVVQLSYAIGKAEPLAINIKTNKGNVNATNKQYERATPYNMIHELRMIHKNYEKLAQFGHFATGIKI